MRGAGLRLRLRLRRRLRFSAVLRQMRKTNAVAYCGGRHPPHPSAAALLARAQADVPTKPLKHSICA